MQMLDHFLFLPMLFGNKFAVVNLRAAGTMKNAIQLKIFKSQDIFSNVPSVFAIRL